MQIITNRPTTDTSSAPTPQPRQYSPSWPNEVSPQAITTAAAKTGEPSELVTYIAESHAISIRRSDAEASTYELTAVLIQTAKEYGGRTDIPTNVLTECIRLVQKKFPHLAPREVREAYRQKAAGETTPGKNAEMFGGEFNALNLGETLRAYADRRKTILAAYIQANQAAHAQALEAQRKADQKAAFEKQLPNIVAQLQQTANSWEDIPEYLYASLLNRGYFTLTKTEADQTLLQATQIAKTQLLEQRRQNPYETSPQTTDQLAKTIARKITVYQKIIQPWQHQNSAK